MEFKPTKKVTRVSRAGVTLDDVLRAAGVHSPHTEDTGDYDDFALIGRQLTYQGQELGAFIQKTSQENPQLLSQIASELEKFRDRCTRKKKTRFFQFKKTTVDAYSDDELSVIYALCDAYVLKISELVKRRYDQTKDGLNVTFDEWGQLVLNGLNIHAVIEQCRTNPSEKSLMFLKGIRARLMIVLQNKADSKNYERLKDVIDKLCEEIDAMLDT